MAFCELFTYARTAAAAATEIRPHPTYTAYRSPPTPADRSSPKKKPTRPTTPPRVYPPPRNDCQRSRADRAHARVAHATVRFAALPRSGVACGRKEE